MAPVICPALAGTYIIDTNGGQVPVVCWAMATENQAFPLTAMLRHGMKRGEAILTADGAITDPFLRKVFWDRGDWELEVLTSGDKPDAVVPPGVVVVPPRPSQDHLAKIAWSNRFFKTASFWEFVEDGKTLFVFKLEANVRTPKANSTVVKIMRTEFYLKRQTLPAYSTDAMMAYVEPELPLGTDDTTEDDSNDMI